MKKNKEITRLTAEKHSATEAARLLSRDLEKYWKRVLGLYVSGILHLIIEKENDPEIGILTRETYLIFRHIDDLLDGDIELATDDRGIPVSPIPTVRRIQNEILNPRPKPYQPHHISEMARHSLQLLEKKTLPGENAQQMFSDAIDAMVFDYKRRQSRRADIQPLTRKELDEYYFSAFQPVVNLMFIGTGSKLRVTRSHLTDLTLSQGHIYSIRDLEEDWNNKIINIPAEVLGKAKLSPTNSYEELIANRHIRTWIQRELKTQRKKVQQLKKEIARSKEKFTIKMVNVALLDHMLSIVEEMSVKFK